MIRSEHKAKRKRWSADEIRYLRRNYGKKNITGLAQELERTVSSVGAAVYVLRLKKAKKDIRSKKQEWPI